MIPPDQDRVLFESPLVRLIDITWHASRSAPTIEYLSRWPEVTLMRRGIFQKEGHAIAADPNTLMFFDRGEAYRMVHPVPGPCACTAILVEPACLTELHAELDPAAPDRPEGFFRHHHAPCEPEAKLAHQALLARIRTSGPVDRLAIEESALTLVRNILQATRRFHSSRPRTRRRDTERAHIAAIEGVKQLVAARFRECLSLAEIARAVHCAPAHLCALFKGATGMPIHRYLLRVRLAAACERLLESDVPLSSLGMDLGFASHSHLTRAFRREFGIPPSALRRVGRRGRPRRA